MSPKSFLLIRSSTLLIFLKSKTSMPLAFRSSRIDFQTLSASVCCSLTTLSTSRICSSGLNPVRRSAFSGSRRARCINMPIRTRKNSSWLDWKIIRNLSRSRSGTVLSSASCRTRWLNSSQLSSRLIYVFSALTGLEALLPAVLATLFDSLFFPFAGITFSPRFFLDGMVHDRTQSILSINFTIQKAFVKKKG